MPIKRGFPIEQEGLKINPAGELEIATAEGALWMSTPMDIDVKKLDRPVAYVVEGKHTVSN